MSVIGGRKLSSQLGYYLGCPVWACERWRGEIFPENTRRRDWLQYYSKVFNTVEGNTTFYAIPPIESVRKWAAETENGFRFALKFPRVISHESRLVGCKLDLNKFLECLEILDDANRLGPSFLQLPPDFDRHSFQVLQRFLADLPDNLPFAVEVRHRDYFSEPLESEFAKFLQEQNVDRVVFDSRPLFHFPPSDVSESEARRRKPQVPVRKNAFGQFPLLRFIGNNRVETVQPWIDEWAPVVAKWMEEGRTPYVFAHTPYDGFAPKFARLFHEQMRKVRPSIPELPERKYNGTTQLNLFADNV